MIRVDSQQEELTKIEPKPAMARRREPRGRIRDMERRLGFFSERGLQRTKENELSADIKTMLDGIDRIKRDHLHLRVDELPTSRSLEDASRDLFWVIGPKMWPEVDVEAWICTDPEFYPRPLVFLDGDRPQ